MERFSGKEVAKYCNICVNLKESYKNHLEFRENPNWRDTLEGRESEKKLFESWTAYKYLIPLEIKREILFINESRIEILLND